MKPQYTFSTSDLKDSNKLLRKLNDNASASRSLYSEVQSMPKTELVSLTFATGAYATPYDAPFPVTVQCTLNNVAGVFPVKIEKAQSAGPTRGPVAGVHVLWSQANNGTIVIESVTGLQANTEYKCTLALMG